MMAEAGSNMVEIEFQCAQPSMLRTAALLTLTSLSTNRGMDGCDTHANNATVEWRFTTEMPGLNLNGLYPWI